ncbi:MAG: M28 family peptidase [Conexivisphaerales archaeon]
MNVNEERLHNDVSELLSIGERKAGSNEIKQASKYVRDSLEESKYEAEIMHFPILTSFIVGTPSFKVNDTEIPCMGVYFSGNAHDVEGELVYDPELNKIDLQGKIVLTDVSYSPPRPAKAKIALERGAVGIVYLSFGKSDSRIISTGGIKFIWGNPTSRTMRDIPRIPAVSISRLEGNKLINRIKKGERLTGSLDIKTKDQWVDANQPVGFKGTRKRDLIIFGTPFEALGATAIDNSAANSALLEIARVIKIKNYDVMVVFTDGHEIAEAAGSTYLVDSMWPYLKQRGAIYINIESFGAKGATKPVTRASPLIRDFTKRVEKSHGIESEYHYEIRIADSSFTGIGLPYYWFTHEMDDNYVRRYHGANHGWWYRSEADTIEHIDFHLLVYQTSFIISLYEEILRNKHVPYSMKPYLEDSLSLLKKTFKFKERVIENQYSQLRKMTISALKKINEVEEKLGNDSDMLYETQRFLIREVSNVFMTINGRYDQDPYGVIWKDDILPGLSLSLSQYKENNLTGFTSLIREINRVYDAMDLIQSVSQIILKSVTNA